MKYTKHTHAIAATTNEINKLCLQRFSEVQNAPKKLPPPDNRTVVILISSLANARPARDVPPYDVPVSC